MRSPRVLAWSVVSVALGLSVVTAFLLWANRETLASSEVGDVLTPFLSTGWCVIGAVVAANRPSNRVGWLMLAFGAAQVLMGTAQEYAVWAIGAGHSILPARVLALGSLPGLIVAAVAILFPTGRLPSRRWLAPIGALIALAAVGVATAPFVELRPPFRDPGLAYTILSPGDSGFVEGEIVDGAELREVNGSLASQLREPAEGEAWLAPALVGSDFPISDLLFGPYFLIFLPILAAAGVRLVVSGFRSTGETRLQLRWLAYVIVVALLLVVISASELPYLESLNIVAGIVLTIGVPAAIAVAITRYRLYEIDRIINRTVVYGVVVAVLAGAYGLLVVGIPTVVGVTGDSDLLVAAATLAVFFGFSPLRRRVQRLVDRRFYRSRYDAQLVVEEFSARLRDEVDPERLTADWIRVVRQTMEPASVSVWIQGQ